MSDRERVIADVLRHHWKAWNGLNFSQHFVVACRCGEEFEDDGELIAHAANEVSKELEGKV